jgi:penicillin-binding protein 2
MMLRDRTREERHLKTRLIWMGVFATLAFFLLAGRLWYLEIRRGDEFFAKSEGNFIKELRVPADRGMILDRKGEILVDNRPSYDVYVTPAFCAPCEEVMGRLAGLLPFEDDELSRMVNQVQRSRGLDRFRQMPVKIDLTRDELDVLEAKLPELPGVDVIPAPHRHYREGKLAAHVLGYMSEVSPEELKKLEEQQKPYRQGDYIGKRGVERRFEDWLKGEDGVERVVADAKGRKIPLLQSMIPEDERVTPSKPGRNLVLTLDARLQRVAEAAFADVTAGALVAVDVNTGYILAMLSKPAYDPNVMTGRITRAQLQDIAADPLEPMVFRATQNHFHPGSTFKVITQLAALEHGFDHGVSCNGGYSLGGRRWRCWNDRGHGFVDPLHAIQQSCDTWFYAAADRIGIEAIADMSRRFGLGQPTGLDMGFEVGGVVPDEAYHDRFTPGGYQKGFALNTAIGQGDNNVTPLQLAMVYATIANGGRLYRPQLVQRVETPTGELVQDFPPVAVRDVKLRPEHLQRVRDALDAVVNQPGGTAYSKRLKDVRVAGKTGTAQVIAMGEKRVRSEDLDFWSRDHAWFASFAPVEEPKIAVVVLNEHGGHGGSAAAPIAMQVIEAYFQNLAEDAGPTVQGTPPAEPPAAVPSSSPPPGPSLPPVPGTSAGHVAG